MSIPTRRELAENVRNRKQDMHDAGVKHGVDSPEREQAVRNYQAATDKLNAYDRDVAAERKANKGYSDRLERYGRFRRGGG